MHSNKKLTEREIDALQSLANDNNYSEVADELFISREAVRSRLKKAYKKLGKKTSHGAVAKGIRKNIIL